MYDKTIWGDDMNILGMFYFVAFVYLGLKHRDKRVFFLTIALLFSFSV